MTPVILNPQLDPEISSDVLRQSSPIINGMRTSTETSKDSTKLIFEMNISLILFKLIKQMNLEWQVLLKILYRN